MNLRCFMFSLCGDRYVVYGVFTFIAHFTSPGIPSAYHGGKSARVCVCVCVKYWQSIS